MKYLNKPFCTLFIFLILLGCNQQKSETEQKITGPTRAEIKKEGDKFQLYVGGEPFYICYEPLP